MSSKNKLDDRLNGLVVATVVALSIGLNISLLSEQIGEAAEAARASVASVVAPPSQVTAMLMAVQTPR